MNAPKNTNPQKKDPKHAPAREPQHRPQQDPDGGREHQPGRGRQHGDEQHHGRDQENPRTRR